MNSFNAIMLFINIFFFLNSVNSIFHIQKQRRINDDHRAMNLAQSQANLRTSETNLELAKENAVICEILKTIQKARTS